MITSRAPLPGTQIAFLPIVSTLYTLDCKDMKTSVGNNTTEKQRQRTQNGIPGSSPASSLISKTT